MDVFAHALARQWGNLLLFAPLCLGVGIGLYFAVATEPTGADLAGLGVMLLGALWGSRALRPELRPLVWAIVVAGMGFGLAAMRAQVVAEPVLGWRYYGPVEGRVIKIDRSGSGALRLTLDQVVLPGVAQWKRPARVRVSLHGDHQPLTPLPGMVVAATAHLSPPGGPLEPGGFDFQRQAWFQRLGAVGYTRAPAVMLDPAQGLPVARVRHALTQAIKDRLPGPRGAVAAALITGDRGALPPELVEDLRRTNLAHLLAISGLHMGLLTGLVFTVVRFVGALIPWVALNWPVKRIAAGAAIAVGGAYLVISGAAVATERAFIMVTIMYLAVILGRKAITLRAVAIAALIVLILRPEALTGPGFQMSFAATTALVVVFRSLSDHMPRAPGWASGALGVLSSSLVAGLATAPFAAAHFNQISHYGLIANLLSVPVMGALVMPAALIAAALAPLGLASWGLWAMGLGIGWIMAVADQIAAWPGAVSHVVSPGGAVLPLIAAGGLWWSVWSGRARWVGVPLMVAGLALWTQAERPALIIAETGGLLGVMTPDGRGLSKPKGDGFAARVWLENDGAPVAQSVAAGRGAFELTKQTARTQAAGHTVLQVRGKRATAKLGDGCDGADLLVLTVPDEIDRPCAVLDLTRLSQTGAVAIMADGDVLTAEDLRGQRVWTTR